MKLSDVRPRLKELRRSQAELARYIDLDPSLLTKTLKGERSFRSSEVVKVEQFFGEKLEVELVERPILRKRSLPDKLPVYGYAAAGGEDRIAMTDDKVLAEYPPPPFWNGAGEMIYVRLLGDSMEPRYFSGEVVAVRLHYPPAKGQDCLIVFHDGSAVVKTYDSQKDGRVFARQYGEDRRIVDYDASTVREIHTIWRPGMI